MALKIIMFVFFFLIFTFYGISQQNTSSNPIREVEKIIILIEPIGETYQDLPVMQIIEDTSEVYRNVYENVQSSFIKESIVLYSFIQNYLFNTDQNDSKEPAYLGLTENQGGFPKFGFVLMEKGEHIVKKETPYIDINIKQAIAPQNKLMSLTQLYPHELGHIMLHLLCKEDSIKNNTKNVDMHFFSLITDYSTAFNEGFAEHIENVSRSLETNEIINTGIQKDLHSISNTSVKSIKGFKRDFIYPFRMGFFKMSMISWYQRFEDYKRHEYAFNGNIKYKNTQISKGRIKDRLSYRNSGVSFFKDSLRNKVQMLATEGAISSFFTKLSLSELSKLYKNDSLYLPYTNNMVSQNPIPPIQNQFIKYFNVLHKYVVFNHSKSAQLIDFVQGYLKEYPEEKDVVTELFIETMGFTHTDQIPEPLWLMVKDYNHRLVVFDPFDGIIVPLYTFDLNAAEVEDILTIKGIGASDAYRIISYREQNGLFQNLKELNDIPGVGENAINLIEEAILDQSYLEEKLENFEPKLSISQFLLNPLKYLYSRTLLYSFLLFGLMYFFFYREKKYGLKILASKYLKIVIWWGLYVLFAAIIVFAFSTKAILLFSCFTVILGIIIYIINRKRQSNLKMKLAYLSFMFILLLISF